MTAVCMSIAHFQKDTLGFLCLRTDLVAAGMESARCDTEGWRFRSIATLSGSLVGTGDHDAWSTFTAKHRVAWAVALTLGVGKR